MVNAFSSRGTSGGDSRRPEEPCRSRTRSHTTTTHCPSRRTEFADRPISVRPPPSNINRERESSRHDSTHTRGRESSRHDSSSVTRGRESSVSSYSSRSRDSSSSSRSPSSHTNQSRSATIHELPILPHETLEAATQRLLSENSSACSSPYRSSSRSQSHHPSMSSHRSNSHHSNSRALIPHSHNHSSSHGRTERSRSSSSSGAHSRSPSHHRGQLADLYDSDDDIETIRPSRRFAPPMPMGVVRGDCGCGHHGPCHLTANDGVAVLMGLDGFQNLGVGERTEERPQNVTVEITEFKIHITN